MIDSVLVTGSSGTIGTALVQSLLDDGYDVTGLDVAPNRWSDTVDDHTIIADLTEEDAFAEVPNDVDLVVHFAANARVHKLVEEPTRAQENFDTTFNTLEFARRVGADVIFGSSREVYGNNGKVIYSEEDTYVDECESPYTASKVGGEAMVKAYHNCYDIESCILRFSNVYGRYDASDRVVPLFIAQAYDDQPLSVYGSDKILDFTYLDDCVAGIHRTIDNFHKAKHSTFNVASGTGASILELAELVVDRLDSDSEILVEGNRRGEVNRYVADIRKAQKILGYEPQYSMVDGLDASIEWYLDNEDVIEDILTEA